MPSSELPDRPSLEYLKKLAKQRLRELQRGDPVLRLSDAQLALARAYGFPSWRALKAEVDRRRAPDREAFFAACRTGDLAAISRLLDRDPVLLEERPGGTTCLHAALRHPEAVRLLLARGADPNARDQGDNALPLHFAAGGAPLDTVRALLDAGSDVQGEGDAHHMDTIGWATCFAEPRREVVALLLERGARHHVFSAIALNDVDALREVVARDPAALKRRLSRSEQEQTALHYVIAPADGLVGGTFRTGEHYRTLALLLELKADLEAKDAKGRTPLDVARLRGDQEAMRLLHAAGARAAEPALSAASPTAKSLAEFAGAVGKLTPMLAVPDADATVAWYRAVGFELTGSHEEDGKIGWAEVALGKAAIMFVPSTPWREPPARLSLWIHTDRLDDLYTTLKERQLERTRALLAGEPTEIPEVRFKLDLWTAFYGQREFCIRDCNGVELCFSQPISG